MSEMPPEPAPEGGGGGGNFFTQKYMGIPGIVWLGGVAVLAYFLFFRNNSGSSTGASSSGGGGTSTTGDITFTPPPTQITVPTSGANPVNTSTGSTSTDPVNQGINPGQPSLSGVINPQPSPSVPGRVATTATSVQTSASSAPVNPKTYTVQAGDTLASIAKKFGISVAKLAHANVYVKGEVPGNAKVGQPLGTGAGLLTGQVLKIPSS